MYEMSGATTQTNPNSPRHTLTYDMSGATTQTHPNAPRHTLTCELSGATTQTHPNAPRHTLTYGTDTCFLLIIGVINGDFQTSCNDKTSSVI
jgi:hypothetical protein